MNNSSEEIIEINGKEYTLFLNRKGIVAWEKYTREETKKAKEKKELIDKIVNNNNELITNETNPFDDLDEIDNLDEDKDLAQKIYIKLYWIMLYSNYKLNIDEVKELYISACNDYGEENIIALGIQMLQDANKDINEHKDLKNLPALKPRK